MYNRRKSFAHRLVSRTLKIGGGLVSALKNMVYLAEV